MPDWISNSEQLIWFQQDWVFLFDVLACRTSTIYHSSTLLKSFGSKSLHTFLTISTTGCTFQYFLMLFIGSSVRVAVRLAWMNRNRDCVMVSLMIGTRYLDCQYIFNLENFKLPMVILIPRYFFFHHITCPASFSYETNVILLC